MPACLVGYWYYNQHLCTCCSHRLQLFIRGQKDAWLQLKDRCLAQPIGNWNCKCNPVLSGTSRAVFLDVKIMSMYCRTCGFELFSTIDQDTISSGNRDLVEPRAVLLKDYWQYWCADVLRATEQNVTLLNSAAFMAITVNEPYCLVEMANPLGHCAHDLLICKFFLAVCSISCGTLFSVGNTSVNLYSIMIIFTFVAGETPNEPVAPIESPSNSQQSSPLKEAHSLHPPLLPMS